MLACSIIMVGLFHCKSPHLHNITLKFGGFIHCSEIWCVSYYCLHANLMTGSSQENMPQKCRVAKDR